MRAQTIDPLSEAAVVDLRFQQVKTTESTFGVVQLFESISETAER
jgi:hypothetical protein